MFTQQTKVRLAEESGQWMGRFSYSLRCSGNSSCASQPRSPRELPRLVPCSRQAAWSGAAAGCPRLSW